MDQIKQIDQNQDNNINTQELLDAIKPNGFLSNENNLEEVGKLLNNEELNDGDKELLNSLTNTIDEEINRIIESGKVTEEDINLINIWKKLLGENDERVQKLEELISQGDEINQGNEAIIKKINDLNEGEQLFIEKFLEKENAIEGIDTFLNSNDINLEDEDMIKYLNILNNIIGEDTGRVEKLKNMIGNGVTKIMNRHYNDIASNRQNEYNKNEIMIMQLRGKIGWGLNLQINGIRGNIYSNDRTTNEGLTNLCIHQLESITKSGNLIDTHYNSDSFEDLTQINEEGKKVDEILEKTVINENDIKILNERNENFGNKDNYRKILIEKFIYKQLEKITETANKWLATHDQYNYKPQEIKIIQLYANVIYGENLTIDGKWENNSIYGNNYGYDLTTNAGLTNMYICIFEIKYRQGVIEKSNYKNLLKIPNIDARLKGLNNEQKNRVMEQFFKIFLRIRQSGKSFEHKIQGENLESLLTYLINAERYNSMDEVIRDEIAYIENCYAANPEAYNREQIEEWENTVKTELKKFQSPREYFTQLANEIGDNIMTNNQRNIENSRIIKLNNEINNEFKELQTILTEESELKNEINKIRQSNGDNIENEIRIREEKLKKIKEQKRKKLFEIITSDYFEGLQQNAKDRIYSLMRQEYTEQEIKTCAWAFPDNERMVNNIDYYISYNQNRKDWKVEIKDSKYYLITQTGKHYMGSGDEGKKKYNEFLRYKNEITDKDREEIGRICFTKGNNCFMFAYMVADKGTGEIICYRSQESGDILNHHRSNRAKLIKKITIEEMDRYKNLSNIQQISSGISNMIDNVNTEARNNGYNIDIINTYESIDEGSQKLEPINTGEYYRVSSANGSNYITNRKPENIGIQGRSGDLYFYELNQYNKDHERNLGKIKVYKLNIGENKSILISCDGENEIKAVEKINEKLRTEGGKIMPTGNPYITFNNMTRTIDNYNGYPEIPVCSLNGLKWIKEGENGDTQIYDINTRWFRESNGQLDLIGNTPDRIISKDERDNIHDINRRRYELIQTPELNNIQPKFDIIDMQNKINELYDKMGTAHINRGNVERKESFLISLINPSLGTSNLLGSIKTEGGISDKEAMEIFSTAQNLGRMCRTIKGDIETFKQVREYLGKLKEGGYGLDTGVDAYITALYNQVDYIIGFVEGNKFQEFCNFFQNDMNVFSNDTTHERVLTWLKQNGIKVGLAIAAAVGIMCAIPSGGSSSLLTVAALSTLGGMAGQRLGTRINEGIQNCRLSDEKRSLGVRYDDPTDIELLVQKKINVRDFLGGMSMEFLQGTAATFGFMYFGQVLGKAISTSNSKFANLVKKVFSKRFDTSNYADDMVNSLMKKGQEEGFCKKFLHEFWEECHEEVGESGGDAIGQQNPALFRLGGMISLYHSLTPGPNINIMQNTNANFDAIRSETRNGKKVMLIDMCYDPTINYEGQTALDAIKSYYLGNGAGTFTYNEQTQTITKKGDPSKKTMESVDVEIRLIPSKAPIETRMLVNTNIGNSLGITVNDITGECEYDASNQENINRLRMLYEKDGGVCEIKEDGTLVITDKNDNTFEIKPAQNSLEVRNMINMFGRAVEALGPEAGDTELEKFKYKTKKEQYQKIKEYCTKTDFMSEHNLYEIFNERISGLETEGEIKEFLVKREATLKFFSGNEVRFRNPETKEIVEGNIFNYGKSLFGDKFETAECQGLRKVMEGLMFNQSLDNPLQYNSHGFDHSILVDAYSQMVIDQNTIGKVCKEYGITPEGAEVLLRLSAVFHDFGYPEIVKVDENGKVLTMDKSMHGLEGGLLFINEIEPAFREFMKLYGAEGTKLDQIVTDMRDAISFHSADKIEKPPYKYKLHTDKGDILINEDINAECAKWIKESYCIDGGEVEIHTQDGAFNENSDAFKKLKQALESQGIKVAEKCKIDEPTNRYTTSVETEAGTVNQYYRGRKGHDAKGWPIGIEIQPIDLYDSPLAGIVRLADNMDMAYNRLSEVQKNPVFMDLMYNLGMNDGWDGTGNPPASKIFQEMEGLKNAAKNVKEGELTPKDREDGKITRGEFETKVREFLSKYGEITTLGVFTYNAEEGTRRRDLSGTMEFNSEWKTDIERLQSTETSKLEEEAINILNKFKKSLVTELNNLEYPEGGPRGTNQYLEVIQGVSQEDKTGSYSLRHVAGLTCIEDVSIHDGNFVVKLDRNVYYDSSLSSQTVREKGISINVNDYHVWRLFDASSKVTIDKQASNIRMVDSDGNLIGVITRCSENGKFKPYYTLMDYNGNIVTNAQGKAILVDEFSTAQRYYQLSMMETSAEFTPQDRQDMMDAIINDGKTFAELQEIYKDIKGLKEGTSIDEYKDDNRMYGKFSEV